MAGVAGVVGVAGVAGSAVGPGADDAGGVPVATAKRRLLSPKWRLLSPKRAANPARKNRFDCTLWLNKPDQGRAKEN